MHGELCPQLQTTDYSRLTCHISSKRRLQEENLTSGKASQIFGKENQETMGRREKGWLWCRKPALPYLASRTLLDWPFSLMKSQGELVSQLSFNTGQVNHVKLHKRLHKFLQLHQAQKNGKISTRVAGTAKTLRLTCQHRAAKMKSDVHKSVCNHLSAICALVCEASPRLGRKWAAKHYYYIHV